VPNVLVTIEEYNELLEVAKAAGLGTDLVVQTAYGDSGKTTFFIDDESGWKASARHKRQRGQGDEADQQRSGRRRSSGRRCGN
jgi:biotin carboxylase